MVENFRAGALEKWNLGWDALSRENPKLVLVRISGYGQTGPYRERPGFAAIAEAMARIPLRHRLSRPAAGAAEPFDRRHHRLAARRDRRADGAAQRNGGKGQVVDVALYEAMFNCMESLLPEYDAGGYVRERSGSTLPGIAPSNLYPCSDGAYVLIAGNADSLFQPPDDRDRPRRPARRSRARAQRRPRRADGAHRRRDRRVDFASSLRMKF